MPSLAIELNSQCDPNIQLQESAALWLLKMREMHRLPLSVMDALMEDIESLIHAAISCIKQCTVAKLRDDQASEVLIRSVGDGFSIVGSHLSLFNGLKSQHQQQNFFCTRFNLVVSNHLCKYMSLVSFNRNPHRLYWKDKL